MKVMCVESRQRKKVDVLQHLLCVSTLRISTFHWLMSGHRSLLLHLKWVFGSIVMAA